MTMLCRISTPFKHKSDSFYRYQALPLNSASTPAVSNREYMAASSFSSGFTLIELMVTVTILAIIATIAAPSIFEMLANMEAKRVRQDIMSTLSTGKVESLMRRQDVTACLANDQDQCDKDSQESLLLFVDKDGNRKLDDIQDTLLVKYALNAKYGRLHLRAGNRHYIRFAGDSGTPRGFFGHIKYCPTSSYSKAMYQVSFSQTGIIRHKPNSLHPTGCP